MPGFEVSFVQAPFIGDVGNYDNFHIKAVRRVEFVYETVVFCGTVVGPVDKPVILENSSFEII